MSGGSIIKGALLLAIAVFLALLFVGAWLLKKRLPVGHPWREKLSPENLLHAAQILAVALIAGYFAVLIISAL